MDYYVSRQVYWPDGVCAVEVVSGGSDNSGPDQLVPNYRDYGEGDTFDDPREAVRAAIAVRDAWQIDLDWIASTGTDKPRKAVLTGFTTGYGMVLPDEYSDDAARAWAEKEYAELPKCDHCGDLLPDNPYGSESSILDNEYPYCSEYCAETAEREFLDSITAAVHCTACDAMLPKDTRGWCDECGADYPYLERIYE